MTFGMSKARIGLVAIMLFGLTACEGFEGLEFLNKPAAEEELSAVAPVAGDVTERDVEAPEIFSAQEPGLWDGRPSLGGVWVAYPGVKDPERVIIRNTENGQFVIGALFRRERENPGPKLQMSSDAALALGMLAGQPAEISVIALGMLAGQPAEISVIALRKEEVLPVTEPEVDAEVAATSDDVEVPEEGLDTEPFLTGVPATETIDATTLDTVEAATAAIDRASDVAADAAAVPAATPAVASAATSSATAAVATPVAATAASAPASGLEKPFIQIGIFSVKGNADSTADSLRSKGVLPIVKEQENQGKAFYRVLVGPATNESERATLLATITDLGFSDSYFVTN